MPTIEAPQTETKPVIVTLVLRASGVGLQKIRTTQGVLVFTHKKNVGHCREYTDLATFHREEEAIRAGTARLGFLIKTRIGNPDHWAAAEAGIATAIADRAGHRPTKYDRLMALRKTIEAELLRLESQGIGSEPETVAGEQDAPLSPREKAKADRLAFFRRAGEFHVRGIVEEYQNGGRLGGVKLLNNFQGMMDSLIAFEFPDLEENRLSMKGTFDEFNKSIASQHAKTIQETGGIVPMAGGSVVALGAVSVREAYGPGTGSAPAIEKESVIPDIETLPIDELKARCKLKGFESPSRVKMIAFLKNHA